MQRPNRHHFFYFLILVLGISFYCYEFFLRISPSVVVDDLQRYFQVDTLGLTNIIAIYYVGYAVGQIPAGLMLDRYPLRIMLGLYAFWCAVGTLLFVATTQPWLAEVGRFIVGFASSYAFVGAIKMVKVYLPERYFTRMVALVIALGTLSAAYGNVLLAYLENDYAWRGLFHGVAGLGFVLAVLFFLAYFVFPKQTPRPESHAYTFQQVRKLFGSRFLWINALLGGLFYLPAAALTDMWGNMFLHATYHLDFVAASSNLSFLFIGWVVGSPLVGYLADLFKKPRLIMAVGAFLMLLCMLALFQAWPIVGHHLHWLLLVLGITSSAQLVVWRLFNQKMTDALAATGIAVTNMMITLTIGMGQFGLGWLLNRLHSGKSLNLYTASDFQHVFWALALPLVIVILVQGFYGLRD